MVHGVRVDINSGDKNMMRGVRVEINSGEKKMMRGNRSKKKVVHIYIWGQGR